MSNLKVFDVISKSYKLSLLISAFLAFWSVDNLAFSQSVFNQSQNGLDTSFCNDPAVRQTVVYIDDTVMQSSNRDWALDLQNKLQATLTPGENVSVVRLSPLSGTSAQVWSGCWPDYTSLERAKLQSKTYFFSANPLKNLADQQKIFFRLFLGAVTQIWSDAKGTPGEAHVDASKPITKEIIGALASDSARYSQSTVTNRVIVYSDLAEKSDLGNAFVPIPNPFPDLGQQLGLQFHSSVFYFFGVGVDVTGDPDFIRTATAYWRAVLQSTGGTVGGIGSTLSIPNVIPIEAISDRVALVRDNQNLTGTLSLLVDKDGNLVDSWLSILRLTSTSLSGTFVCGNGNTNCSLHAKTDSGVTLVEKMDNGDISSNVTENLDMTGAMPSTLSGTIGAGDLTFPISTSSLN